MKYKINENDHNPPHVHIEGGGYSMRVNLLTMEVMDDEVGFSRSTVRHILEIVKANRNYLLERWEAIHGEED